tara:strand:+ start:3337 stop:3621 length:285 start_codon:yes stop_codon:yes gene_type:complete
LATITDKHLTSALAKIGHELNAEEKDELLREAVNWGIEQWPSGKLPYRHILIPQLAAWVASQLKLPFQPWNEIKNRYPQIQFTNKFLKEILQEE